MVCSTRVRRNDDAINTSASLSTNARDQKKFAILIQYRLVNCLLDLTPTPPQRRENWNWAFYNLIPFN
jgi:hypothetical protein